MELSKIREHKEKMLEMVRQNFKNDGTIVPVAFILYPNGKGEVIGTQFTGEESQMAFANYLKRRCRERRPVAIMMVSEVKMLVVPISEKHKHLDEKGNLKGLRPRDHKDSKDAIVCIFETSLTSESIIMEVRSVGGVNLIVDELRDGTMAQGIFKDILTTPIGEN